MEAKKTPRFTLAGYVGPALCEEVYDGDTPHLAFKPWPEIDRAFRWTCRMARIQAPEIRGATPLERQLAVEARDYLSTLILDKHLWIRVTAMDKYGRPVVEIYGHDDAEISINDAMVRSGHAVTYGARMPWRRASMG